MNYCRKVYNIYSSKLREVILARNCAYLSLGSVSFVLFRAIYYITPDHYSRECAAQTIEKQWNIFPLIIIPRTYFPRLSLPLLVNSKEETNKHRRNVKIQLFLLSLWKIIMILVVAFKVLRNLPKPTRCNDI